MCHAASLNARLPPFSCQDYPSYAGFSQNQYPQYFSPSYNPPYVPTSGLCSSPLSTSTYVLQEAPHNVPSQSSESLAGKYTHVCSHSCLWSELPCEADL